MQFFLIFFIVIISGKPSFLFDKQEIIEISNCVKVVKTTTYQPTIFGIPITFGRYENHLELEDGRKIVKKNIDISKVGELHCDFSVIRKQEKK